MNTIAPDDTGGPAAARPDVDDVDLFPGIQFDGGALPNAFASPLGLPGAAVPAVPSRRRPNLHGPKPAAPKLAAVARVSPADESKFKQLLGKWQSGRNAGTRALAEQERRKQAALDQLALTTRELRAGDTFHRSSQQGGAASAINSLNSLSSAGGGSGGGGGRRGSSPTPPYVALTGGGGGSTNLLALERRLQKSQTHLHDSKVLITQRTKAQEHNVREMRARVAHEAAVQRALIKQRADALHRHRATLPAPPLPPFPPPAVPPRLTKLEAAALETVVDDQPMHEPPAVVQQHYIPLPSRSPAPREERLPPVSPPNLADECPFLAVTPAAPTVSASRPKLSISLLNTGDARARVRVLPVDVDLDPYLRVECASWCESLVKGQRMTITVTLLDLATTEELPPLHVRLIVNGTHVALPVAVAAPKFDPECTTLAPLEFSPAQLEKAVGLRNSGTLAGQLTLTATPAIFTISPSVIDLEPSASTTVTVAVDPAALADFAGELPRTGTLTMTSSDPAAHAATMPIVLQGFARPLAWRETAVHFSPAPQAMVLRKRLWLHNASAVAQPFRLKLAPGTGNGHSAVAVHLVPASGVVQPGAGIEVRAEISLHATAQSTKPRNTHPFVVSVVNTAPTAWPGTARTPVVLRGQFFNPAISVSARHVDFRTPLVGECMTRPFTITNPTLVVQHVAVHSATLPITFLPVGDGGADHLVLGPSTTAKGVLCFHPSDAGPVDGTLHVYSLIPGVAGSASKTVVRVTGHANQPIVRVSDVELVLPPVALGKAVGGKFELQWVLTPREMDGREAHPTERARFLVGGWTQTPQVGIAPPSPSVPDVAASVSPPQSAGGASLSPPGTASGSGVAPPPIITAGPGSAGIRAAGGSLSPTSAMSPRLGSPTTLTAPSSPPALSLHIPTPSRSTTPARPSSAQSNASDLGVTVVSATGAVADLLGAQTDLARCLQIHPSRGEVGFGEKVTVHVQWTPRRAAPPLVPIVPPGAETANGGPAGGDAGDVSASGSGKSGSLQVQSGPVSAVGSPRTPSAGRNRKSVAGPTGAAAVPATGAQRGPTAPAMSSPTLAVPGSSNEDTHATISTAAQQQQPAPAAGAPQLMGTIVLRVPVVVQLKRRDDADRSRIAPDFRPRRTVQFVTVRCSVVSPAFSLAASSTSAIDFGPVPAGTAAVHRLRVANHQATDELTDLVVVIPPGDDGSEPFRLARAVRAIPVLGTGDVYLSFLAPATADAASATFTRRIELRTKSTCTAVTLAATSFVPQVSWTPGAAPVGTVAAASETEWTWDLGDLYAGESATWTLAATNTGAFPVSVRGTTLAAHLDVVFAMTGGDPLAPRGAPAQCTVAVTANPATAVGVPQRAHFRAEHPGPGGARDVRVLFTAWTHGLVVTGLPTGNGSAETVATFVWTPVGRIGRGRGRRTVWRVTWPAALTVRHLKPGVGVKVDPKKPVLASVVRSAVGPSPAVEAVVAVSVPASAAPVAVEVGKTVEIGLELVCAPGSLFEAVVEDAEQGDDAPAVAGATKEPGTALVSMPVGAAPPPFDGNGFDVVLTGGYDAETKKLVPDTAPRTWRVAFATRVVVA
ncbi:hypothetical protein H9P43_001210 [Blastocladiella emersonii ATCC 22665]|nr:hypothetical protein H9P43_001210 [Blastocladiella emersonii ATCC 22665]